MGARFYLISWLLVSVSYAQEACVLGLRNFYRAKNKHIDLSVEIGQTAQGTPAIQSFSFQYSPPKFPWSRLRLALGAVPILVTKGYVFDEPHLVQGAAGLVEVMLLNEPAKVLTNGTIVGGLPFDRFRIPLGDGRFSLDFPDESARFRPLLGHVGSSLMPKGQWNLKVGPTWGPIETAHAGNVETKTAYRSRLDQEEDLKLQQKQKTQEHRLPAYNRTKEIAFRYGVPGVRVEFSQAPFKEQDKIGQETQLKTFRIEYDPTNFVVGSNIRRALGPAPRVFDLKDVSVVRDFKIRNEGRELSIYLKDPAAVIRINRNTGRIDFEPPHQHNDGPIRSFVGLVRELTSPFSMSSGVWSTSPGER